MAVWDLDDGSLFRNFDLDHQGVLITSARMSKDRHMIVTCSEDRTVKLWNDVGGLTETVCQLQHNIVDVDFSYDDKMIVAAVADGEVKTWFVDNESYMYPPQGE